MRRRNLLARGTIEQEPGLRRSNRALNCIVPLQIAQVQVSTELLEVSGMDSRDSFPKAVLPLVYLRNLPAVAPPAAGPPAAIAATGSALI